MKIVKYLLLFLLFPSIAFAQFSPFGGGPGSSLSNPVTAADCSSETSGWCEQTGTTGCGAGIYFKGEPQFVCASETAETGLSSDYLQIGPTGGDKYFRIDSDGNVIILNTLTVARKAGAATSMIFYEVPANGDNKVTVKAPDSLSSDVTLTFPATTGTFALDTNQSFLQGSSLSAGAGGGSRIPGSSLTAGSVYYQSSSGLAAAKADAAGTMPAVCLADSTTSCMYSGVYRYSSSQSWTVGGVIYVSAATAGALTQTRPATATNQIQRVGIALSADTILIMPSLDVGTAP